MMPAEVKSNMTTAGHDRAALTAPQVAARLVAIQKIQQLAGHFPSAEAMDRAGRILTGETTPDKALAEIHAKYSRQSQVTGADCQ